MSITSIDVNELPARFAEVLEQAREGTEVVVTEKDVPQARLVPIVASKERVLGRHQGKFKIADDFDAPLPDEFWLGES